MKQTHDLIQDLSQEHVAIKSILKIITKIVDNTNSKKIYNVKDVEGIIDFIDYFVVKNHYCKEELLFHSLSTIGATADIQAFNVLIQDHINETAIVKEIIVALDKCKSISPGSVQVITNNLKTYVDMLHVHIELEDTSIYPLISKLLSKQLEDDLIVQFKSIEHKVFETLTILHYHELTMKLEEKYTTKREMVFF